MECGCRCGWDVGEDNERCVALVLQRDLVIKANDHRRIEGCRAWLVDSPAEEPLVNPIPCPQLHVLAECDKVVDVLYGPVLKIADGGEIIVCLRVVE